LGSENWNLGSENGNFDDFHQFSSILINFDHFHGFRSFFKSRDMSKMVFFVQIRAQSQYSFLSIWIRYHVCKGFMPNLIPISKNVRKWGFFGYFGQFGPCECQFTFAYTLSPLFTDP
jgi:hypothetical protein